VSAGLPRGAQRDEITFGRPATAQAAGQDGLRPGPAPASGGRGPADPAGLAIASRGLTKRFRSGQVAVDDVALAVPRGSVYGFLGPNGSGKTTTIRMLLGLVRPTEGSHRLLGAAMPDGLNAVLPRVGSLVEGPAFYSFLSGQANLARYDAADRTADPRTAAGRIALAMERVGLSAASRKHYRAYSLGMKQRLAIAAGMLQPRELMILDEPTNGLDPQGTREVRNLVRQIAADGTTIFVSSHLLAEVEQICSHVGVMRAGRLVFQGPLDELRGRGSSRILVRTQDTELAAGVLAELGLADIEAADGQVSAQLGGQAPEKVCAALVQAGVGVAGLATPGASLEDLFVELTGEGFDVNG
jgi:ABC-2 type transport system ATP-binding protein